MAFAIRPRAQDELSNGAIEPVRQECLTIYLLLAAFGHLHDRGRGASRAVWAACVARACDFSPWAEDLLCLSTCQIGRQGSSAVILLEVATLCLCKL
jgi:hypothetical protein